MELAERPTRRERLVFAMGGRIAVVNSSKIWFSSGAVVI
jgi:hypothetical protein